MFMERSGKQSRLEMAVHKQNLSRQTDCRQHAAEFVTCRRMH